mgnify:CR=1 FL=1
MNANKMIVMDLDGTLLNGEGNVTQKTKDYLNKLKKEGDIIVIATGRILKRALVATDEAEFANYIVTDAGAAVYKKKDEKWEEIYEDLIPRKIVEDIISMFDCEKYRYINICSKNQIDMLSTKYHSESMTTINYTKKEEIIKNIKETIHISVGFENNKLVEEYRKIFSKKYTELDITIMQDSFDNVQWIEIFTKGNRKYKGIYKISQIENIENKDIIAFGDGLNDVDMIEKCGVGVAMKNALSDVKARADFVTDKSNLEDGIIDFLAKYLTKN